MSWYKDGSVNIEQGSNTVIGIGTKWANPLIGVCAGQMLILKTANTIEIYEIASVQSDTQLTLVNKYEGETKSGVNYEIPTVPKVSIEALALRISEMLNYYQQQMEGWQAILTGEGDIKLKAPDGRVVTIKSQRALTETINNTIKSQNELTKTINDAIDSQNELTKKIDDAIDSQNKLTETVNNTIKKSGENSQLIKGSLNVDELIEKGQRVYSPNNKPIPDDIGALAATKTVVNNVPTYKVGGGIDATSISVNGQQINPILNHMWVIEHESNGRTDIASSGHQSCFTVRDNGLCGVWDSPRQRWRFLFDGDGNLVKGNVCANQDWYNLTNERQQGVMYTNTTGKPIMVSILCLSGSLWASKSVEVARANGSSNISAIVPHGVAYAFSGEVVLWSELR